MTTPAKIRKQAKRYRDLSPTHLHRRINRLARRVRYLETIIRNWTGE